jgi:hypothetical protein
VENVEKKYSTEIQYRQRLSPYHIAINLIDASRFIAPWHQTRWNATELDKSHFPCIAIHRVHGLLSIAFDRAYVTDYAITPATEELSLF